MNEQKLRWYIVRVQGGKEKKVQEYIQNEVRRAGKEDMVPQVLIPTEKVYQVKNGKRVLVEKICYSQYVFVQAVSTKEKEDKDFTLSPEIQHLICDIPFVSGFLTKESPRSKETKRHPYPLPEAEINQILGKVDEMIDVEDEAAPSFVVGEAVKVIDGPFNGFNGNVTEILEDKKKLKVEVKIFGRPTTMELNFVQVIKE